MIFPSALEKRLRQQLGNEYDDFLKCCGTPSPTSFRVNTLKAGVDEVIESLDLKLEPVPWCPEGFFTDAKIGDTVQHFQGLVYVQEAASMIAAQVLDPRPGETVLDLTAAPGSKTTQMAAMMDNSGCIIANDVSPKRVKTLRFNLNRMGVANTIVTTMDAILFNSKICFDRILLDAPCSNTGQLRDNPDSLETWRQKKMRSCSEVQKKLVDSAVKHLADDGVLVYSTCTFSPEENEDVVDYALSQYGLKVEKPGLDMKSHKPFESWNGKDYDVQVGKSLRIYPHDNDTAGFFLAKLVK